MSTIKKKSKLEEKLKEKYRSVDLQDGVKTQSQNMQSYL